MNQEIKDFLTGLLDAKTASDVDHLIEKIRDVYQDQIKEVPVGYENNSGQIQVGTDPAKGVVERITNGIDAILELEHERHRGMPDCRTPKEAASAWLGIPSKGLHELSIAKRRDIAMNSIHLVVDEGIGKAQRTVSVRDFGIGISAERMPTTILSLGGSNKRKKFYLVGAFGQGGSSTFVNCKYTLICSRLNPVSDLMQSEKVAFTVVYYDEYEEDDSKLGQYNYLTLNGKIFEAELPIEKFPPGTLVKHFEYDLSNYSSGVLGPSSVYGLLQRSLFDPVLPIYLEDRVHNRRRVIKGVRNALNGAVDEPEDERIATIRHSFPLLYVPISDFGNIGIEYWVLDEGAKEKYRPSSAFVDNRKPVILTVNGQTHAEWSGSIIRNQVERPFLANRIVIHVDCNNLSKEGKRRLFSSGREESRKGEVAKLIEETLIELLRSDPVLESLNEEAKTLTLTKGDEESEKAIKGEIAKVLRLHGFSSSVPLGAASAVTGSDEKNVTGLPPVPRLPRPKILKKIDLHDPPNFVKMLVESPLVFYPGQRRYIRIETDAPSSYHNAIDNTRSRFNIIIDGEAVKCIGTTELKEGRMRVVLDCHKNSTIGASGTVRVELSRQGLPSIHDSASFIVMQKPDAPPGTKKLSIPDMRFVRVDGPDDDNWGRLDWPQNVNEVASSSDLTGGILTVYYSTVFPHYTNSRRVFERSNPKLVESFDLRYRIWLAVHSLILQEDKKDAEDDEKFDIWQQGERCRLATIASMIADKEVRLGLKEALPEIE